MMSEQQHNARERLSTIEYCGNTLCAVLATVAVCTPYQSRPNLGNVSAKPGKDIIVTSSSVTKLV